MRRAEHGGARQRPQATACGVACSGRFVALMVLLGLLGAAAGCGGDSTPRRWVLFKDRNPSSQSSSSADAAPSSGPSNTEPARPSSPAPILSRPIADGAAGHATGAPTVTDGAPTGAVPRSDPDQRGSSTAPQPHGSSPLHVPHDTSPPESPPVSSPAGTPPGAAGQAAGTPGAGPQPSSGGASTAAPQVRLSAGTALAQSLPDGTAMFFSVDYEFLDGPPQSGVPYFLVIQAARGGAVAIPVPRLQPSGNLVHIMPRTGPEIGPFFAVLVQGSSPQSGQRISNSVELKRVGF
jgi:hypothetical protein